MNPEDPKAHMSGEGLILLVGLVAGWLAREVAGGTGLGLAGDLITGILGAFVGSWLTPQLDIHLGSGMSEAIDATIGAVTVLLIIRLVRGGGRWRQRGASVGRHW